MTGTLPPGAKAATRCVHAGGAPDPAHGGMSSPVYPATAYAHPNPTGQNLYPRYFNVPSQEAVAAKIAALEGGEAALVFASGMGAIHAALAAHLRAGDHAVFTAHLYGGTFRLAAGELPRRGVDVSWVDGTGAEDFLRAFRPNTKACYLESPSNPLLRVTDIAAVAEAARARGVATFIDNTFATPLNQNPLALGVDVVLHSGTKYLNGHGDVMCGAAVAGSARIAAIRSAAIDLGAPLDARACALLERGLKTLALRVERHNANALALAHFLQGHPAVAAVHYPGLPGHPGHALAARQMRGFGGMLSFDLRDRDPDSVLSRLRIIRPALSLGGVESLVCLPARTSHRDLPPAEREKAGISDRLLRLSVGIEDADDLRADLEAALA